MPRLVLINSWEAFKEMMLHIDSYVHPGMLPFYNEEKEALLVDIDNLTALDSNEEKHECINRIETLFHRLHECCDMVCLEKSSVAITSPPSEDISYPEVQAKMLMFIHNQRELFGAEKSDTPDCLSALFQTIGPKYTHIFLAKLKEKARYHEVIDKMAMILPKYLKKMWTNFFRTNQMETLSDERSYIIKVTLGNAAAEVLKIEDQDGLLVTIAAGLRLADIVHNEDKPSSFEIVSAQPIAMLLSPSIHCFITPYFPKKDLEHVFDKLRCRPDNSDTILATIDGVAKTLFAALDLMEENNFCCTDIKPENFLVRQDASGMKLGLGDLKSISATQLQMLSVGSNIWNTSGYISPEFNSQVQLKVKPCHSYQMGALLLSLFVGFELFDDLTPKNNNYRMSYQELMDYIEAKDHRVAMFSQPKSKIYLFLIKQLMDIIPEHRPGVKDAHMLLEHLDGLDEVKLNEYTIYKDYYQLAESLGVDVCGYKRPSLHLLWEDGQILPMEALNASVMNAVSERYKFLTPLLLKGVEDILNDPRMHITLKTAFIDSDVCMTFFQKMPLLSKRSYLDRIPSMYLKNLHDNVRPAYLPKFSNYVSYYDLVTAIFPQKLSNNKLIQPPYRLVNLKLGTMQSQMQMGLRLLKMALSVDNIRHKYQDLKFQPKEMEIIQAILTDDAIDGKYKLLAITALEALLQVSGLTEEYIYEPLVRCLFTEDYQRMYDGYQLALIEALTFVINPDIDEATKVAYRYLIEHITKTETKRITPETAENYVLTLSQLDMSSRNSLKNYVLYRQWAIEHMDFDEEKLSILSMILSAEPLEKQLSILKEEIIQYTLSTQGNYDFLQKDALDATSTLEVLPALNVCALINQELKERRHFRHRFLGHSLTTRQSECNIHDALKHLDFEDFKACHYMNEEKFTLENFAKFPDGLKRLLRALSQAYDSINDVVNNANKYIKYFSSWIEQSKLLADYQENDALERVYN